MNIKKIYLPGMIVLLAIFNPILTVQATSLNAMVSNKNLSNITISKEKNRFKFVSNELIVQFKKGQSSKTISFYNQSMTLSSESLGVSNKGEEYSVIKIQKNIDIKTALEKYKADPNVKAVSYNYANEYYFSPNDPSFSGKVNEMWGLHDTAPDLTNFVGPNPLQNTADKVIGNDIDAEKAWDIWNKVSARDKENVVVAVIDSGVDYTHPDLIDAMWDGSHAVSPTPNHGVDIGNGDNDPYPLLISHGTHVAGTIAATANNGIGIPGVASGVKIMAIRVGNLHGLPYDDAIISGINYAVKNGADIINLSLGRAGAENTVMTQAIKNAVDEGVLLVVAAGNDGNDNDSRNVWPSNYANLEPTMAGVISVAATDQADLLINRSNFGAKSVTIGAPGVNIKSTLFGRETKPENIASGRGIPFDSNPAVAIPYSGDATHPSCGASPSTCFDNTLFSNVTGVDCVGSACQWGWFRLRTNPGLALIGDASSLGLGSNVLNYGNSIDGTITSKIITVAANKKAILSFTAVWDLECDVDYVDVEVFDGTNWILLSGDKNLFNANESATGSCMKQNTGSRSTHTLTGRMGKKEQGSAGLIKPVVISYDISAYSNSKLQVRFRFVTNNAVSSTVIPIGVQLRHIGVQTQVADYSNSYGYKSGTSMASPHVAGIAALIKGSNPAMTNSQIKTTLVNAGDDNASLTGKTSSGKRANAYKAIKPTESVKAVDRSKSSGGCSLNRIAKFDPLFPGLLILLSIFFIVRKKR